MSARELITEHLDLWTGAVTKKSRSGRGNNSKVALTGIKKLRELILELAVRGKLVEQDSKEEAAHRILKRLAGTKRSPKDKPQLPSTASQPSLPNGWTPFRVGDYLEFQYGKSLPAKQRHDSGNIEVYGSNGIVGLHTKALTEAPCIVIGRKGSAGALNKALAPSWTTDVAYYVQPPQGFDFEFTYLLLQSLQLDQLGKGIKPGVNRNEAYALASSLPPLEEQHRIVQKVDELMALCDRLEQQTSDQLEAHETLVGTLLDTLTQSENATELADNWARLAVHFDTLFTTEQSIDKLKQTILQLAVIGRLVEQDKREEPAESMLTELAEVKEELVARGLLKKEHKSQPVDKNEAPYEIPQGWSWCNLTDIGELARGKSKHRPRNDPSLYQDGAMPLVQTGDVARASPWIATFSGKYNQKGVEQSRVWKPGTLCITIAATIGETGVLSFNACFPDSVVGFTPFRSDIRPEYFEYFLRTAKQRLEDFAPSTAQKNINLDVLQKLLVPLPPQSEMARIVQKVDELMALCDQLKERLNQASETRCQLAETVVENALH